MKYDALIIIDVQTALIERNPYHKEAVIHNINALKACCRRHQIPIIY